MEKLSEYKKSATNTFRRGIGILAVPVSVFFLLLAINAYVWSDYSMRKNKIIDIQTERKLLLSTVEDQKNELDITKQNLEKFETENSTFMAELASSTNTLQSLEVEILKNENELALFASTTELEVKRREVLLHEVTSIKKESNTTL